MCGFFIGLLVLVVIFKLLKGGRCGWRRRYGGGGHGPRGGGRHFMRWIFEDLETTPGQERTIEDALHNLKNTVKDEKESFRDSLRNLADAFRAEDLDHEAMGEAWVRQDKSIDSVRHAVAETLGEIHATLTERQRARLAELIEKRRFGW